MGDKGSVTVCGACHGPARSNAKLHTCDNCGKSFHTACSKLASVSIDGRNGKACQPCITKAVPMKNLTRVRTMSNSSMSDATGSSVSNNKNEMLHRILKVMGELRTSVDTRFDRFEAKLSELDGIGARVEANEAGLVEVKRELHEIKQRLDQGVTGDATTNATDPTVIEKILTLEKKNAELSSRLATVSSLQLSISTDLVIGGLSVPTGCELKPLAMAVLAAVHPDIDARDVVTTRLLLSKAKQNEASSSVRPVSVSASTDRPPPILVTVSSRALLEAIIRGKVKKGKLHTSALESSLSSDLYKTIKPAFININEFLPGEVFALHRLVRQKAKLSNGGFISFVRSGHIYVRRKKSDKATLIASEEDLNRFLAS